MFKQTKWSFTGASGTKYPFSILPKSEGAPPSPGVYILAYTHPRGHLAGWQMNPLHITHAENMYLAIENKVELDPDQRALWNCVFVLVESDAEIREACVHDLEGDGAEFA